MSFKGKIIGLSGGIGAGKNTLSQLFAQWGALILDSDETAKKVVEPESEGFLKPSQGQCSPAF